MSYQPKTWENKPSTASPINATNLNHMEGGIKTNDDNIADAQNAILTLQGEMLQAQGDISALETLVDSMFPVDTESGNPAVITDAFGGACKSLKLTLEPIQSGSGTPSPQNVRPISGRTSANVKRTGKNLCNPTLQTTTQSGVSCTNNGDGTYTFNGTNSSSGGATFFIISSTDYLANPKCVGKTIKVCGCPTGGSQSTYRLRIVTSNWGGVVDDIGNGATFTLAQNVSRFYFEVAAGATCNNVILKPMLTLDTSATYDDFEQYNGETLTRSYGQNVYGGSDDVTGDGAVSTHKMVDLGTLTYYMYSVAEGTLFRGAISDIKQITSLFVANKHYCSAFPCVPTSQRANYTVSQNLNNSAIDIINNDYSDVDTFKAAMSGIQLCYEVATPASIPLTSQNITLLHGDNVLTTDADSIEVSYSADIALYIAKKIAEGSQNNRSLSKGGSGDEEVKEEEKEEEIEIKEAEPLTKEVR